MFAFTQGGLIRCCYRRCVGSGGLLKRMHKRTCSMSMSTPRRRCRELGGSAGRTGVITSPSSCMRKHDIVRRPASIVIDPKSILLSSRTIKVEGILFALRQFPQYRLDLGSRFVQCLPMKAGHDCRSVVFNQTPSPLQLLLPSRVGHTDHIFRIT